MDEPETPATPDDGAIRTDRETSPAERIAMIGAAQRTARL
jgi:hypothetical protein